MDRAGWLRGLRRLRAAFHDDDSPDQHRMHVLVSVLIVLSCLMLAAEAALPDGDPRYVVLHFIDRVLLWFFVAEFSLRVLTLKVQVPRGFPVSPGRWLFYQIAQRAFFCLRPMSLLDLAAIISFVPALRALRVLRLLRFARAFRYARPLQTLAHVLRSNGLMFFYTFAFFIIATVMGGVSLYLAEARTNPNLHGLSSALYWAVVTITTVGYGDISPQTGAGRFVAVLLMVSGLGVLAMMTGVMSQTLVGHIFLLRTETVRMSLLSNHIIVCGWSAEGLLLLSQLEREHPKGTDIVVFAPCERPADLPEHIRFVTGNPSREVELEKVRALYAATVLVVAHQSDHVPPSAMDAQTVLTIFTLRAYERRHKRQDPLRICAEIREPENVEHARVAGADEIIQSSLLASSIMAHASVFPGTSDVLADLLSPHTSQTLFIEALIPALEIRELSVSSVRAALLTRGAIFVGTRHRGDVELNPPETQEIPIDAQIIYVSSRSLAADAR